MRNGSALNEVVRAGLAIIVILVILVVIFKLLAHL